jgi:arylsulfatase A-like enzyme
MTNRTPNILFIVVDDLNSWIGALAGHPQTKTPNIDRLAGRGPLFERAYCTAPYCNSSRMSVFLGLQPSSSGIYQNETADGRTYFEALRAQGYRTATAGKVFHGTYNYADAGRHQMPEAAWLPAHDQKGKWDEAFPITPEPMPPARPLNGMFDFSRFGDVDPWNHLLDWGVLPEARADATPDAQVVRAASDFLARPRSAPFLFAAGFYKPHLPWYAPQRFFDLHPVDQITLPDVRPEELDDVPPIARQWALNPPDHETILRHNQWHQAVQGYLAAISYCDAQIGEVLDALDASPASDDTIIVLWSDNGFHLGEKLHWRKFVLWEEATRVPLIIVPPRRSGLAPRRISDPVSLVDLFPTLFDMAGLEASVGLDGRSLLPLIQGNMPGWPVLTSWRKGNHSLRFERFRYTRYSDGNEEFYDHAADPRERRNLARLPLAPAALIQARTLLESALEKSPEA